MATLNPKYTPPTKASTGEEWVRWYDQIKSLGRKNADSAFAKAWATRGSDKASGDPAFRDYMHKNGIEISGGVFSDVRDSTSRSLDGFGNFFKMGGYTTAAIVVVVLIFVMIILYKNLSNADNTVKIIGAVKPGIK